MQRALRIVVLLTVLWSLSINIAHSQDSETPKPYRAYSLIS